LDARIMYLGLMVRAVSTKQLKYRLPQHNTSF
jgi:hypothetical protein